MFEGNEFGTICPEVKKGKAPPFVLLGSADAYDLVVVEILITDYPNTIFVVLISWNPIIPLGPNKDNPNAIFQVGDVFGFSISIDCILS